MSPFLRLLVLAFLLAPVISACAPANPPTSSAPAAVPATAIQTAVSQPTAAAQPAPVSLRVVNLPFIAFAPFWIAQDEGYFAEQGLNVELVDMSQQPDSTAAFLAGEADVTSGLVSASWFNAAAKESPLKVVADKGYIDPQGCSNIALLARKDLLTGGELKPETLKGKTLTLVRGTWNEYYVEKLFATVGLSLDDLKIVNVPSPSVPDAMDNGSIDLAVNNEPWVTRLKERGHLSIFTPITELMPGSASAVTLYGPRLIGENADVGRRFMVAYLKAVRRYNEGKTERNLEILSKYAKLDKALLEKMCWPAMRDDGAMNVESLLDFQTWAQGKGMVKTPVTAAQIIDTSYLDYANAQLPPVQNR
jgi:NitT/TauT family transport system substrate-binding protein